jgi:hypothetical protein
MFALFFIFLISAANFKVPNVSALCSYDNVR